MMLLENSSYGMIVSTADYFTYRAYEASQRAQEKGYVIELVDRGKLNRMLDAVLPGKHWPEVLEREYADIIHHFDESVK